MAVLPFAPKRRAGVEQQRWRVSLTKGPRRRLFEILPAGQSGVWQTWVRFDGQPHRALITRSHTETMTIKAQFEREIAELERDGWIRHE